MSIDAIIIGGPTASGKTEIAHELAKFLNTEIISADSMCVYKFMNIGTAKPSLEKRKEIKYHMIDVVLPNEYFDTYIYVEKTKNIIKQIKEKGKIPIIVGGTYLYIQALLYGLPETSEPDFRLRKKLENIANKKGLHFLYEKLKTVDKVYAEKIGKNDKKRIIRALEVFINTGKPFSTFHKWHEPKMKVLGFYTNLTQEELNKNIEKRTYYMIEQGLEVECINLLCLGYKEAMTSSQAIGYKEMIPYIEGKSSLKEAIENIIKNTKEYASRQRRWFQKTTFTPIRTIEDIKHHLQSLEL